MIWEPEYECMERSAIRRLQLERLQQVVNQVYQRTPFYHGMEKIGTTVIPVSSGKTERQIKIMKDFGATALVAAPSYALHMAEVAQDMGVNPRGLKLKVGLFGSEPWSESMRKELEKAWVFQATDNYGLSETGGAEKH